MHRTLCTLYVIICLVFILNINIAFANVPNNSIEQKAFDLLKGAKPASSSSNAQLSSSLIDTGVDLAQSVKNMLEQQQKQNEDIFKALFIEQKQHQTVESELAKQREQLRERAVFLERMQQCINEAPASEQLASKQNQLDEHQRKLDKLEFDLKKQLESLAQREATLIAREEHINRKHEIAEDAIKKESETRSFIEAKATELKEQTFAVKQAEADLLSRFDHLSKREEEFSSRERDLNKMVQDVRSQQHRFAEIRTEHREQMFKDDGELCGQYDQCTGCISNPKCGWCSKGEGKGTCMTHNVNALADGLTSGQCPMKSWFSKVSDRITSLNLNVFGGDVADKEQRAAALFNVIISAKYPDFIALQEVSDWFITLLKEQQWFHKYYHITDFNTQVPPGGLAIMSRFNITKTLYSEQFQSNMNAVDQRPRVLLANVEMGSKIITVATTTLDWRDSESRVEALKFIKGITDPIDNLLLMGDLNFDEGAEPETTNIPTSWIDVWPRVHNGTDEKAAEKITRGPNRYGFTWDPATNWYARYSDPNSRPSRIDRVFLRSTIMLPREIHLVGCPGPDYLCQDPPATNAPTRMIPFQPRINQVTGNVIYPSSHYGLLATFSVFMPHC